MVELLCTVATIAILASLLFSVVHRAKQKATKVVCISNLRQLSVNLSSFVSEYQRYPLAMATPEQKAYFPGQQVSWISTIAPEETRIWANNNDSDILIKSIILCPSIKKREKVVLGNDSVSYGDGMYGYNGLGQTGATGGEPLGLAYKRTMENEEVLISPVRSEDVVSPSNMIAIGDGVVGLGTGYYLASTRFGRDTIASQIATPESVKRVKALHGGMLNAAFCDGHVSSYKLHDLFAPEDKQKLAMWNRDNKAH